MTEDIQAQAVENLNNCTYISLRISYSAQFMTFVTYVLKNGIQSHMDNCFLPFDAKGLPPEMECENHH